MERLLNNLLSVQILYHQFKSWMFLNVAISIFQGLFKNIVLDIALVTKKFVGYFRFFFPRPDFFRPVPNLMHLKKIVTKNPLNYYSLKVTKFHKDSVKKWECFDKKNYSLFRVKFYLWISDWDLNRQYGAQRLSSNEFDSAPGWV